MKDKKKVSVVLPSYNESENIEEAISRISKALGENLHEIIIVDDNSPDRTWELVEKLNRPKVRLIRRMHEKGLASALDDGIQAADGDIIVWLDCDLGIPPENIPRLVKMLDKYDIAIGSRYVKGGRDTRSWFRGSVSILLNLFIMLLLGHKLRDYTSGFIAVRKDVTRKVRFSRKGFGEYFIEFVFRCKQKGYTIAEIGYVYGDRKGGVSKSDDNLFILFKLGFQYSFRVVQLALERFIN